MLVDLPKAQPSERRRTNKNLKILKKMGGGEEPPVRQENVF